MSLTWLSIAYHTTCCRNKARTREYLNLKHRNRRSNSSVITGAVVTRSDTFEAGAIATVDVSPSRGVELYLEDREMRLSLAPDDWDGNLLRLGATIGDLARRRELSSVQEVRASQNSVWVVLRRPVEQQ